MIDDYSSLDVLRPSVVSRADVHCCQAASRERAEAAQSNCKPSANAGDRQGARCLRARPQVCSSGSRVRARLGEARGDAQATGEAQAR